MAEALTDISNGNESRASDEPHPSSVSCRSAREIRPSSENTRPSDENTHPSDENTRPSDENTRPSNNSGLFHESRSSNESRACPSASSCPLSSNSESHPSNHEARPSNGSRASNESCPSDESLPSNESANPETGNGDAPADVATASGGACGEDPAPPKKKKRSEMGAEERRLMRKAADDRAVKLSEDIDKLLEEQDELFAKYAEENGVTVERVKKLAHQAPSMKSHKKASDYNVLVYFKGKELNAGKWALLYFVLKPPDSLL